MLGYSGAGTVVVGWWVLQSSRSRGQSKVVQLQGQLHFFFGRVVVVDVTSLVKPWMPLKRRGTFLSLGLVFSDVTWVLRCKGKANSEN